MNQWNVSKPPICVGSCIGCWKKLFIKVQQIKLFVSLDYRHFQWLTDIFCMFAGGCKRLVNDSSLSSVKPLNLALMRRATFVPERRESDRRKTWSENMWRYEKTFYFLRFYQFYPCWYEIKISLARNYCCKNNIFGKFWDLVSFILTIIYIFKVSVIISIIPQKTIWFDKRKNFNYPFSWKS